MVYVLQYSYSTLSVNTTKNGIKVYLFKKSKFIMHNVSMNVSSMHHSLLTRALVI